MKKLTEENENYKQQILDLNIQVEEFNLSNSELKKMVDFLESSIKHLKSLQTQVIQSVPKFNECLNKKHINYKNIFSNINQIKDDLYVPLKKITTLTNVNPSDQFTFREISESIENIMFKFENVKENVSDQMTIVNKDMKMFKLIEDEL